jgi:hypothetical protein
MIRLYGPLGQKELRMQAEFVELDDAFADAFIRMGLTCNFSASMRAQIAGGVRITDGIWRKMTDAMVEVGLLEKRQGSPTVVKFGLPVFPILTGACHGLWAVQEFPVFDGSGKLAGWRKPNKPLIDSGLFGLDGVCP